MRIAGCAVDRKRGNRGKKRRTRAHIIADLGVNFVERCILLEGHSIDRIQQDYGIDLLMFTHNDAGEIENGHVSIQVKATDSLSVTRIGAISFSIEIAHLKHWLFDPLPVILVVYDAASGNSAYWIYVQNHALRPETAGNFDLGDQDTVTFHIPSENLLDGVAIRRFRGFKDNILAQVKGVIRHDCPEDHL
jgi:Domain of unknown function (DUF4365)